MSAARWVVLWAALLAACEEDSQGSLHPADAGGGTDALVWTLARVDTSSLAFQSGCDGRPVRLVASHDGPSSVEVDVQVPEGWRGPASLVVEPGTGAGLEVEVQVPAAYEASGRTAPIALLDGTGQVVAEASIDYTVRPSHWVEARSGVANTVLTLAIGASGSYDRPQWLLDRFDAWASHVANESCAFSHVGVVYADGSGGIRWATESSDGHFVDPRSPRALERLRSAISEALEAAQPGVAGLLDEAFRQHPGGGERFRATTMVYRAIESAPQWGTLSTGLSWALGSFEPDGCLLEDGEQVAFAYPEEPDVRRFFHIPICSDFVEDVTRTQQGVWISLDCERVIGEGMELSAWIDGEERRVQILNRTWCGVLLGQCELGMREVRIEGRLDCGG